MPAGAPERIGLILVHGIGEQKRYEHLDGQGRQIIEALKCAAKNTNKSKGTRQTVEIETPEAQTFLADQATWGDTGDGPVQVVIADGARITHRIHLHEVWWADVNESYSLAKQARFWWWGLGLWAFPKAQDTALASQARMMAPRVPGAGTLKFDAWLRARMFVASLIFALGGPTVGLLMALLQRVFNLRSIPVLRTLTNYMSGVKLFLQPTRFGPGIVPVNQDYLDTLGLPPRVSVRRRMIRTVARVALRQYDRWYIVAHSQGTVLALNGLMELPESWPGYFTETQWAKLQSNGFCVAGQAGLAAQSQWPPPASWNTTGQIANRVRLFERFHGLITLGSPIEKFAAIWPGRVPIARPQAFREGTFWINVFDPLDPVSGVMIGFQAQPEACCPRPKTIGYKAFPILLVAHTHYLARCGGDFLADDIANLLTSGDPRHIVKADRPGRFAPDGSTHQWRRGIMAAELVVVLVLLAVLAGLEAHYILLHAPSWVAGIRDKMRATAKFVGSGR